MVWLTLHKTVNYIFKKRSEQLLGMNISREACYRLTGRPLRDMHEPYANIDAKLASNPAPSQYKGDDMSKNYSTKIIDSFTANKIANLQPDEKIVLIGSVMEVVKKTKKDFMVDRIKNTIHKFKEKLI